MHAATQQTRGTMRPGGGLLLLLKSSPVEPRAAPHQMSLNLPRQFYIRGVTSEGQAFRPSDWAERLAGAMSSFRPSGSAGGIGAYIGYSPYCVPQVIEGVKCVIVSEALKGIEPMAWDFVMHFARDNQLPVVAASGPDPSQ